MHRLMAAEDDAGGGAPAKKDDAAKTFPADYVHELREENKTWRQKAQQEADQRKAAEEKAAKAQTEADGKIKEAGSAAEQRIIRSELKAIALAAGIVDVDGLKLVDTSKLKLNDAGEVEGAEDLIKDLKKAKPYLFGDASTTHTGRTPKAKEQGPKKATDMAPDEYKKARAEAIKGGR